MSIKSRAEEFYFNNYYLGSFNTSGSVYTNYMNSLKEIYDSDLRDGFYFQEKYPHSLDLRKDAFSYDDSFIDILLENNVNDIISQLTCMNLSLSHIQVRKCFPYPDGRSSSQEWHRDSYCYDNSVVGFFPPPVKLIFYPVFDDTPEEVLGFVPRTSQSMKYNRSLDYAQIVPDSIKKIKNSNDRFFIFNVSMFHSTLPVREKNVRIIYNFLPKHLLDPDAKACQKMWSDKINDY